MQFPYSVRIRENTDQKYSVFGQFLRSGCVLFMVFLKSQKLCFLTIPGQKELIKNRLKSLKKWKLIGKLIVFFLPANPMIRFKEQI